jgi:hypothetical protein
MFFVAAGDAASLKRASTPGPAHNFAPGARVTVATAAGDCPYRGTYLFNFRTYRQDIVVIQWDHHAPGATMVLNAGALRLLTAAEAAAEAPAALAA